MFRSFYRSSCALQVLARRKTARRGGQTLIELMSMLFGFAGAIVCGVWGGQHGWLLGFVGIVGGFFAGVILNLLLWMLMFLLALLFDSAGRREFFQEIARDRAERQSHGKGAAQDTSHENEPSPQKESDENDA